MFNFDKPFNFPIKFLSVLSLFPLNPLIFADISISYQTYLNLELIVSVIIVQSMIQ